jgi:hypothetical protein
VAYAVERNPSPGVRTVRAHNAASGCGCGPTHQGRGGGRQHRVRSAHDRRGALPDRARGRGAALVARPSGTLNRAGQCRWADGRRLGLPSGTLLHEGGVGVRWAVGAEARQSGSGSAWPAAWSRARHQRATRLPRHHPAGTGAFTDGAGGARRPLGAARDGGTHPLAQSARIGTHAASFP